MSKQAFVFPGQGAQAVGMGRDAFDHSPEAREIFIRADEALGFKLTDIIFSGPEAELKKTYNTQPALLTTSLALLAALRLKGIKADFVAGHSLGEYTALVAAGVLSFEDAVRTVRIRGELMEAAVPAGLGAMAAVLGAEREALSAFCETLSVEVGAVELANVNCPGQIVISGTREGIQAAQERSRECGAKRMIPLDVSGPFHSSLMRPAAEKLATILAELKLQPASIPVIANVTAEQVINPEQIRELLVQQVYSPVLWEDTIRQLIAEGVDTFIEIGPGAVLAGLIKKIDKTVTVKSVNSMQAVECFE
ncbi:MAG: ACP S-malonyltransferase [Gorillibacterium sp.]|nr:ACP S-malonyltransferase [Gorillibacterium sp.]